MTMVKVKTEELTGAGLDWAVAKVVGVKVITDPNSPRKRQMVEDTASVNGWYCYSPSTDWSQGGPLIKKNYVSVQIMRGGWEADVFDARLPSLQWSNSPLEAVCRAVVASRLGGEVEVPQELISSQG